MTCDLIAVEFRIPRPFAKVILQEMLSFGISPAMSSGRPPGKKRPSRFSSPNM